jgi:hypothetical protein
MGRREASADAIAGFARGDIIFKTDFNVSAARAMTLLLGQKKKKRVRRTPLRAGLASHWLLLFVGVLALGVQSFIVKPHFHTEATASLMSVEQIRSRTGAALVRVPSAVAQDEANADGFTHDEAPTDFDYSDCTMCKTAHQNGQYLRPAAAVFSFSPAINYRPIAFGLERISETPTSFSWQTRAPPQA